MTFEFHLNTLGDFDLNNEVQSLIQRYQSKSFNMIYDLSVMEDIKLK